MSLKNGIVVIRPSGSVELDEDMKALIKANNLVTDMKGLESNISDHREYMNKMASRLGLRKQDKKPEAEPGPKAENKVDQDAILKLLKEIAEVLNQHSEAIENLAEAIEEIQTVQSQRPTGRAPVEPTKKDLEIINKKFEEIGLTGEIRKARPFEFIRGRFVEKP